MSDMSDLPCACETAPLERLRYFNRQLLNADDMRTEQDYFREKMRRHNRFLHGWGVACGCAVEPVKEAKSWTVQVCPGYAVGPQGDDIQIDHCVTVDLRLGATPEPCTVRWPCPPVGDMPGGAHGSRKAYIAVRYAECYSRPVKVLPAGCGCDETQCDYSRIRDSFEIKVLWTLPESHLAARKDDKAWLAALKGGANDDEQRQQGIPVPPCPECASDPWVVLATVLLPADDGGELQVSYADRRALLATQRLQVALAAVV
ncbi:hypothetical protein [Ramlibacter sp.]|uniref:hypothetical protein n=1 Tax=Ramlibacter sp. TaxID=1917967 RepID=UPI0017F60C8C|nr:hypothetical protein [Ramlibacter sp.]MBA2674503.1 hypothetical protein [Ramlibacter sp.]